MYLFSHVATSIDMGFLTIKRFLQYSSDQYHFRMILNGTISMEDADGKYILEKDDIILIHPGIRYKFDSISDNQILDVSLTCSLFESMIRPGCQVVCNSSIGRKSDYAKLKNLLTDMIMAYQKEDNNLQMCSLLYALIDCVNEYLLVPISSENSSSNELHHAERIAKISNYINTNYILPLNQQTLADHMFLTPQYLSKFIRQNFGMTFSRYLNQVRLEHALEELKETDHSVTTIAFNNGFASTTAFNKVFREFYNTTPSAYRQNIMKPSDSSDTAPYKQETDLKSLFSPVIDAKQSGSGVHLITMDTARREPMKSPWLQILNVGLAQNVLSHNFYEIFLECQSRFHFQYARFQNVFSEKIFYRIPDTAVYDFTNFDDVVNLFYRNDICPFIELGDKPDKTSYDLEHEHSIKDPGQASVELSCRLDALDALLKHSINRYGLDYVSRWKFELWAEQDEYLVPLETPEEYLDKFLSYKAVIRKYLPTTCLGGPGFNASGSIENFLAILNGFVRKKTVPDFISIYLFPYEPNINAGPKDQADNAHFQIISPDPHRFRRTFQHIKGLIRQTFPARIPLYVTECNSNLSPEVFVPNSAFQAAFVCKNMLDLLHDADGIGYWIFSDISNEFVDPRPNNTAGIGLIDNYGIKKPSYFAYEFLSRLGNELISKGPGHIMTSSYDNQFQLLAFNYVHYNKYYCINCREKISFWNTYTVFNEAEPGTLQFELTNLPQGRYKIRKHILNRQHGSFLDELLNILEHGNSTPEELLYMMLNLQKPEVDYYKNICIPRQDITYANCEEGNMMISITLDPHEVNYISISRTL